MYEIVAALSNTDRERISASRRCPWDIRTSEPAAVMYVRSSNVMRRPPVGSSELSWSRHSIISKYGADVAHAVSARPFDMEDGGTPCRSLKVLRMAWYASSFMRNSFVSNDGLRMLGRLVDTYRRIVNERIGNRTRRPVRPGCRFNLGRFAVREGGARVSANWSRRCQAPTGNCDRDDTVSSNAPSQICARLRCASVCDRAASRRLLVMCANENGLEVQGRTDFGDVERRTQSAAPPGRARCNGMVHLRRTQCRCRRSMRVGWPSGIPDRNPPGAFRSRSRGEPVRSSRT